MNKQAKIRTGCGFGAFLVVVAMFLGFRAISTDACTIEDQSTPQTIQIVAEGCEQATSDQAFRGRVDELLEQYSSSDVITQESLDRIQSEFASAQSSIPTQFFGLEHGMVSFLFLGSSTLISTGLLGIAFNADDIWNVRTLSVARQVYRED